MRLAGFAAATGVFTLLFAAGALAQAVVEQGAVAVHGSGAGLQVVASSDTAEDRFATMHDHLSSAADRLLTDSAPVNGVPEQWTAIAVAQQSSGQAAASEPLPHGCVPTASSSSSQKHRLPGARLPGCTAGKTTAGIGLARVQQYRPLLEPILREEGVPGDLMAVVLVESSGRPEAVSPKGALGLWQLMPETARRYGLTVTPEKDERLDVLKATRAAARYLRDLYGEFSDWELALAAYNAGEQSVQRAIVQVGASDYTRLHWLLPNETRNYVPAVETAFRFFDGAGSMRTPMPQKAVPPVYASTQPGD